MFFILSKILGVLTQPVLHPVLLLITGLILQNWRKKLARIFIISAAIIPLLYSFIPVATMILRPLENAITPASTAEIAAADGIILLGGYTGDGLVASSRNSFTLNEAAERLVTTISLHHRYPEKPVILSGYSGSLHPQGWSEEENSRTALAALQVQTDRFQFENRSRNTYENALYSYDIAAPASDETWLLITSAAHMPRAAGAFRAAGWPDMIYLPTDWRTPEGHWKLSFNPKHGFAMLASAFHEYAGLLIYWVTGRWQPA